MNTTLTIEKTSRNKWEILLLIWIAFFLNQADRQAFNIVLPLIQTDIGLTDVQIGLIATIFNLFYAVLVPLGGWLGDRVSRKWILTLTVLFWSVATCFTGLCSSFIALVVMRSVATGGGEALFGPNYLPLLAEYHKNTRAVAMAIVQIAYYIGVIASGWLAGWIGQEFGWRWTFIVFGLVGILHGLIMAWRLKDGQPEKVAEAEPAKEKSSLLDGFKVIFTTPTACFMAVGYAALIFVLTGYLTWMPAYMHQSFGMELKDAGFQSMLWTHCFAAVGILIAGRIADKIGTRRLEWRMYMQGIGLILAAPFILLMGNSTELWLVCVGLAGFGFFRSLFDANTYVVMFDVIPPKYHSSTSGVLIMFGFGVGSFAPILLGVIKQYATLSAGLSILGIIWLVAGVVVLLGSKLFYRRDFEKLQQPQE